MQEIEVKRSQVQIEKRNAESFHVSFQAKVTLELPMAQEIIANCVKLSDNLQTEAGITIDMRHVAFVTEEARNYLVEYCHKLLNINRVALISTDHLSNIISTLMIEHGNDSSVSLQLFRSRKEAEKWWRPKNEQIRLKSEQLKVA